MKRMKRFCLWILLLFSTSSIVVVAQSSTCNITLGGQNTTVPEYCYNLLVQSIFPNSRLNFTLVNGSRLLLEPLPENRQVNVVVDDDVSSDGLKAWANLANAFVDSVRRGSLPYDAIIPYLNSTVGDPIADQCSSTKTSSGNEDVDISDLLDDFGDWWAPIIVVTVLGPVFAVIFIFVGLCYCCCRMCGKCGGDLQQEYRDNDDLRCFVLYILLVCCACLLFIGVVFSFVSNEKLHDSIQNYDNTVNTAINNSFDFVEDTEIQANVTLDRYNEINAFVQCEIRNTHISIGNVILNAFEASVVPLINSSLVLANQLNESVQTLKEINATVVKLIGLTQRLQTELNNLTAQILQLRNNCTNSGNIALAPICANIPGTSFTINVDYSVVDDTSGVLNNLQRISDITALVLEANSTFYGIPCQIRNQIQAETQTILREADEFQQDIAEIAADIAREVDNVFDESGFIGDLRTSSGDIQESLDQYETPRYIVSIIICSLTLVVIVVLIAGLLLGVFGFRKRSDPQERTSLSNCAGITLLIAVALMFVFAVILLFLSSFTFFLGANLLKVCYSVAEDPPNDDIPPYELLTRIADNNELWGGYLLGCYILDDSSIPLRATRILNGCRDNGAIYEVAMLARRRGLDLEGITNISSRIPNLDALFVDLQRQVRFTQDQILTQATRDSLNQFSSAGLQAINYTSFFFQFNRQIINFNVNVLITTMQGIRRAFLLANEPGLAAQTDMIIATAQRINDTTLTEIINCTNLLEMQILMLNTIAINLNATVNEIFNEANVTFQQLNNTEIVFNQTRAVVERVVAYADSYANWAVNNLQNRIGRCRPLYAIYDNVYYEACENSVDGINGFWLATGWCVLFFIPSLIIAAWLSRYFRRSKDLIRVPDYTDEASGTYYRMSPLK